MIAALLTTLLLTASPVFDVEPVDLGSEFAYTLLAPRAKDGGAVLLAVDGNRIAVHTFVDGNAWQVTLPEGASAFDFADLDGDGEGELIAVAGDRVLAYKQDGEPELLFKHRGVYAESAEAPFPHVLLLEREGKPVLALPVAGTVELRTPDGKLAGEEALDTEPLPMSRYGASFTAGTIEPPQLAPPGALEFRVTRTESGRMLSLEDLQPKLAAITPYRTATPTQLRDASRLEPRTWPWFSLHVSGDGMERAYYCVGGKGLGDTEVVIGRLANPAASPEEALNMGPPRRYPGILLQPEGPLPDFDGDGYTDLICWNMPAPAPTVDAISRALVGGTWFLRVTMHRFVPEKNRFEARPGGALAFDAPLDWLFAQDGRVPLAHALLRDFDGDGRTDFACSPAPKTFAIWRSDNGEFHTAPDFQYRLPEDIRNIAFAEVLRKGGGYAVALRGRATVYLVRARPGG